MNGLESHKRRAHLAFVVALALLPGLLGLGCAPLRIPAIDPTGEAVIAPEPTTLASPLDGFPCFRGSTCFSRLPCFRGDFPCFCRQEPAFTEPETPPPCPPEATTSPVPQVPTPQTITGRIVGPERVVGSILMSPARIVAPVGSEVILAAGVCGMDGHYMMRQPVQWTVTPGTVGQIVDYSRHGDSLPWCLADFGRQPVAAAEVISRSTTRARLFSRGTPDPADDVVVQPGQAWVRVTSVHEGTSLVSISAPNADLWDGNPQVASIHWVEAQWSLPPAGSLRTGQPHRLETVVSRPSTGEPISGWIVRYEVEEGMAQFSPGGGTITEVSTDVTGRASAEITSRDPTAARIRVRIIRPAKTSADLARLVVGEGWTTVTWSAPGLAVNIAGPNVAAPGANVAYELVVANPGDMPTTDIVVLGNSSPGMTFVDSQPPAMQYGDRYEWRVAQLGPKSSTTIVITCRSQQRGSHRFCATATSGQGLRADTCLDTRIVAPAIALSMTGPERAVVGQQVTFELQIRNQSDRPLTNVVLTDQFDAGLEHVDGQQSPIEKTLGRDLQPGETAPIAVEFRVVSPGTHCHLLEVRADGGHNAQARSCVTATSPQQQFQPRIDARITGPTQQVVGRSALYKLMVRNLGTSTLRGIRVHYTFADSLVPSQATGSHTWHEGGLAWNHPDLELVAGEMKQLEVLCTCRDLDPSAWSRVSITNQEQVIGTAATETEIIAPPTTSSSTIDQPRDVSSEAVSAADDAQRTNAHVQPSTNGFSSPTPFVSESSAAPANPLRPRAIPDLHQPTDLVSTSSRPVDSSIGDSAGNPKNRVVPQASDTGSGQTSGQLVLELIAVGNVCHLNETMSYTIRIVNERDSSDKDVSLIVNTSDAMKIKRMTSPQGYVDIQRISPDGRTWEMVPIAELRPWEEFIIQLQTKAVSSGNAQLTAQVVSQQCGDQVQRRVRTIVSAN